MTIYVVRGLKSLDAIVRDQYVPAVHRPGCQSGQRASSTASRQSVTLLEQLKVKCCCQLRIANKLAELE